MKRGPALEVRAVRLHAGGGALGATTGNARHSWAARAGVLVEVDLGEVVGLGEASPLPGLSPDGVGDATGALAAAARELVGRRVAIAGDALGAVTGALDGLVLGAAPSARFALETALLDALAQARGVSMATVLGAPSGARVEVSALLGDPGAPGAQARALERIAAGARTLKIKLATRSLPDDVAAVAALRAAIGPTVRLVGDANGAWSVAEARSAADRLAPLGVTALEQPVAPTLLAALGPMPIAVWADEALTDPATRAAVLDLPGLGGVALKPTVLGGLAVTRELARVSASRGLGVTVTHALEGPVALAACAAVALALADVAPRAGLWLHPGLGAWPGVEGLAWSAELVDGAGAALTPLDRARLRAAAADRTGLGAGARGSFDLARRARESPGGVALIDERGRVLDWAQLSARARDVAERIDAVLPSSENRASSDVPPGGLGPVAFVAHASAATFVVIHALLASGRPMVPLHPRLARSEVEALCASLGAEALLDVDAVAGDVPDDDGSTPARHLDAAGDRLHIVEAPWRRVPDDERTLAVLPTSGTTTSPKGVVLSRRAFAAAAAASATNVPLTSRHRWLSCMPLAHAGGLSIVTRTLAAGAGVVMLPRFEAAAVLDAIRVHRATHLSVVPTMLRVLLEHPAHDALAALEVVLVGGAACPADLLAEARRRGVPAIASYGLTEACSQVTTQPRADVTNTPEGDSGLPLAGVEIAVRGADGTHLGPEREGEIVVRGPMMMSGYVGAAPLAPDAWFATGDVGLLRADGRLVVLARRTDLIVTGGENVAPAAVEVALVAHPVVLDAVVFGVDHPRWGQLVAAVVVPAAGGDVDVALAEVAALLPAHARPRLVAIADGSLPRTSKGDPDRAAARARWSTQLLAVARQPPAGRG